MMGRIGALLAMTLIAAPAHADGSVLMAHAGMLASAKAGTIQILLGSKDGRCTIRSTGAKRERFLDIAAPCGFVRVSATAAAQTHAYKDAGSVFVIAGPPATASEYAAQSSVQPSFLCSNEGQPIFLKRGVIRLGEAKRIALGFCHLLGFDEKDFYGFAHPVD